MKLKTSILVMLVLAMLILAGCAAQPEAPVTQETPAAEGVEETAVAPEPTTAATTPVATTTQETSAFTIEADDRGFYPSSVIADAGSTAQLTFKVRTENTYAAGLQVKNNLFDTGTIAPGGEKTVTFVVPAGETPFISYWPDTGVRKADGVVIGK